MDLRSHLIFWKEKFTTQPHLWKAQGSSADQSWCGKTRWKWRTTGLSASEWVHSARESDGWQGGGGMVTIGHHWSGYELVFSLPYSSSLFCGWPYKQGTILHSLITTYQSGGYSFVDDFEVRNSRLTVCSDRRPFAQLHICTCRQLSPLIFAGGKCKAFQVVNISSVKNNVSSSLPLSKFLPLSKLLPLPSSTAWFTDFLTWYQSDSHTATGGISSVYMS